MIEYTARRGRRVAYVDRAKYEFRPSFDEWGRFVVLLHAATDDELVHLHSRYFMFRLRDGATADDARRRRSRIGRQSRAPAHPWGH